MAADAELLAIDLDDGPDGPVVRLEGEIDYSTVAGLRDALAKLEFEGRTVTVDCSALSFLDSMGIGTLVQAHARYQALGARLVLRELHDIPLRALEVCGLLDILDVEPA